MVVGCGWIGISGVTGVTGVTGWVDAAQLSTLSVHVFWVAFH